MAGTSGVVTAVAAFGICWVLARRTYTADSYIMGPTGPNSFESCLARYIRIGEIMIGLATGAIALLGGSAVVRGTGKLPWFFTSPLLVLGSSVILSLLFIALLSFFYEGYLHDDHSYTRSRYTLTTALGFSALICLALGYFWMVLAIGLS